MRTRSHVLVGCLIATCWGPGLITSGGVARAAEIGPDVIVAELHQTEYWGPEFVIHAYSVGTISCNIGDEPLLWESWSGNRPVIAQNIFRLKDGRFEQLGQSWLKWAFASLNQDYCGDCQDPGSGSLLGVNCSDPYSAWLNGQQSGLGPKSVVNPFTGELPASHDTPGTGTIDGRVQVSAADIDPESNPGALYFVEGQYVTPDDAAAGNLHNNASYRQVWVEDDLDLTFTDPAGGVSETVRMRPAIRAWADYDPTVGLTDFDVPSDGRVFVAWKARKLGGGLWNYEFAVQNLNSDRGIGGFAVPLPSDTNVDNVGFHDVHYHSGEAYDGTDWTTAVTGEAVAWSTEDFATDANANALRWGTLYNFRFDADVSPDEVTHAEFDLFKPGLPESVIVALPLPLARGDMNCDGIVDFFDIDGFVLALTAPDDYTTVYPDCEQMLADINEDSTVDFFDIEAFVDLLIAD